MRLITRNDTSLAIALIAATVILFQQPLRYIFDIATEIEARYHVDLIPALILLVVVLVFHEYQKHAQAKADARAAEAEAAQARTRSEELEQLMTFGQSLANALDRPSLQQALWKHLPGFARDREFWVLARTGDRWESLLQDGTGSRSPEALEAIAMRAAGVESQRSGGVVEFADVGEICFTLESAGAPVGVIGVANTPPLSAEERKALGAAAALIAIGVRNMQLFLETRELSLRDRLTGCFNRTHGLDTLDSELRRARRTGHPLSILMFDIDHFKTINDQLGHLRGDELLQRVGTTLNSVLRSTDLRCRYGGDEFMIILPDTPALGAEQVAECVRRELSAISVASGEQSISVTVSIGVAVANSGDRDANAIVERADAALYSAKRAGRNRFCVAPASTTLTIVRNDAISAAGARR